MKPRGRPPTGRAKSSTQRSREWRARQQAQDRETLVRILSATQKDNDNDIVLTTQEEIFDFIYGRKPGEY